MGRFISILLLLSLVLSAVPKADPIREMQEEERYISQLRKMLPLKQNPVTTAVIDFKTQPKISIHAAEERGQSVRYGSAGGVDNVLIATYDQTKNAPRFEIFPKTNLNTSFSMPSFITASVQVRFYLPENHQAKRLNLRLNTNEWIYEFSSDISSCKSGWNTVDIPVDCLEKVKGGWAYKSGVPKGAKRLKFPLNLFGLSLEFQNKTQNESGNWLALDTISLTVLQDNSPATATFESGNIVNVLEPGETDKSHFVVKAHPGHAATGKLSYTLKDYKQKVVETKVVPFRIEAGKTQNIPLPKLTRNGIYYVDYTVLDDLPLSKSVTESVRFSVFKPVGETKGYAKGFVFGTQCGLMWTHSEEVRERTCRAMGMVGIKASRDDMDWNTLQPKPDVWRLDRIKYELDALERHGIELRPMFLYCAKWAISKDWKPMTDKSPEYRCTALPDYEAWQQYVHTLMGLLKGRVRMVECWNEPEIYSFGNFSPEAFIPLLKTVYKEAKAADSSIQVQTPGFVSWPTRTGWMYTDPDFQPKVLEGARGFYDVHCIHMHISYRDYKAHIGKFLQMRKEHNVTVPWYPNETALFLSADGEYGQAYALFTKLLFSWANGAIGYNWYCFQNRSKDLSDPEANFGLITSDFQPKMAYGVYNTLATYFTEATFLQTLQVMEDVDAFAFRAKNGDLLIPMWSMRQGNDTRLVQFFNVTGKASRIDMFGNEEPLVTTNKAMTVTVSTEPFILRFQKQDFIPIAGQFFNAKLKTPVLKATSENADYPFRAKDIALVPGQVQEIIVSFQNKTNSPMKVDFTLTLPEGIISSVKKLKETIPAGQTVIFTVPVKTAETMSAFHGEKVELIFTGSLGNAWKGTWKLAASIASKLPYQRPLLPTFLLDSNSQYIKYVPEAPELQFLTWKGPQDASAEVRLWLDRDALILQADVTDDTHVCKPADTPLWQCDSIQFQFDTGKQGLYEFCVGLPNNSKKAEVMVYSYPKKQKSKPVIQATCQRDNAKHKTTYYCRIPLKEIGLTYDALSKGILFNILLNDNDSDCRESYLQLAPGLGEGKTSISAAIIVK